MKNNLLKRILSVLLAVVTVIASLSLDGLTSFIAEAAAPSQSGFIVGSITLTGDYYTVTYDSYTSSTNTSYSNIVIRNGSANLPEDIQSTITKNAFAMLNTKYGSSSNQSNTEIYPTTATFDCGMFIGNILKMSNFSFVPTYPGNQGGSNSFNWLARYGIFQSVDSATSGQRGQIQYNGSNVKTVICKTIDDYKKAINDKAFAGCVITLASSISYTQALDNGLIKEGTVINGEHNGDPAHVMYGLATIKNKTDYPDKPDQNVSMWYSMSYGNYAYNKLKEIYGSYAGFPTTVYQLTGDLTQTVIDTVNAQNPTAVSRGYAAYTLNSTVGLVQGGKDNAAYGQGNGTKYVINAMVEIADDEVDHSNLAQYYYGPDGKYYLPNPSQAWVIDSGSSNSAAGGGRIYCPDGISTVGKAVNTVKLIYFKPLEDHYAALQLSKESVDSSSTYPGGAVYVLVDTKNNILNNELSSIAGSVATASSYTAAVNNFMNAASGMGFTSNVLGFFKTNASSTPANLQDRNFSTNKIIELGTTTTKTVRMVEIYPAAEYRRDSNVYEFTLKSENTTNVLADALKATTVNGSITVAVKGTSTDTTSNDTNLSVKSGNNTAANLVLRAKDNKEIYDYWTTIDLDKVVTGTTTRVKDAGYIVIPSNRSSYKYSGTPGTSSYSSYLGTQTFVAAVQSLNTDSSFRAIYRNNTYTEVNTLLKAIATYVNSNSTDAKAAATLFMTELKTVRGNRGTGYTLATTDYMKNSEFGYYVTKSDGTSQMYRIGTDGSATVNVTDSTRQYFMLQDNNTSKSMTAARDFYFLEVYAPTGYDFPSDAAYECIRLSSTKAISSKSNENGANSGKLLTPSSYGTAADFYSGTPYSASRSRDLTASTEPYSYQSSLHALRGDDDRTQYFYSLNLLKYDNQGNVISGVATPAKFNIGTTIGGSQIASGVTVNSTTAVSAFTNYASTSSTAVFYITETQAATGTEKRAGYWKVEMNGNKSSGAASTVTNITYFKSTSQTTGGTVLGTTKTTNDEGWITNKTSTASVAILNLVNDKYYLNLGMYKAPTFSYDRKTATYVLTTDKDVAWGIAAGTSSSNGIATVTTGTNITWFFGDPAYALTSSAAVTLYIAEKTAAEGMEKDHGIYEVNITPGERSDGQDSHINWVKYYEAKSSAGIQLNETASKDDVHGRYGNTNGIYLVATDTKSHTVTKNGTAVTDGTITSVTVELQDSTGTKVTAKADGTAITNPVTLNSSSWTYTWTGLDSSKTYKTVETSVTYKKNGKSKTVTATSTPSISDVFATRMTPDSTTTGSSTTHTNDEKTLTGGLGVMKVYAAADGSERRANGVVFTVYSDAACQNAVKTLTTAGQGVAEYELPSWYVSAGTTKTFYIKETSNANATDATTGAKLSLEAPDSTVVKAVVTGAAAKTNSSVVYTNNANGAAVTSAKEGNYYLYYYKKANTTTRLYGQFSFEKTDFRNQPQAVTFNVYTDAALNNKVGSKEVTISGNPAKAVVSWTVAELENNAKWPSDGAKTKTFYVQEEESSVPTGYDWNNTVYTVVVTGAANIANSTFTVNGNPVAESYEVVNQSKEYIGALGVFKWGYVAETEKPIEGIRFGVYRNAACTRKYGDDLVTGPDGYAIITIEDYPGVTDGWHECDGTRQTFYLKETDVSNATINGQHVDVEISDVVIKAVVRGHDKSNTSANFRTTYTIQSGTGSISSGTTGTPTIGVVHVENSIVSTKGALGVYKTDNNGRRVPNLQFDIWPGNAQIPADGNTTGSIAHITTNEDGYAFLDVSTRSDGTVAAGTMWLEGTTKTFKIRENKASAESLDLVWKPDVITATVTAVKKEATVYAVSYDTNTSNTTYNNATLAVLNQVNTSTIPHEVTKTFANTTTENAVTELWVTLYDSNNTVVTTDADGNAIANPVDLMAQPGYTYNWTRLVEDINNPYHTSETKIVMKQYKFTTGGAVEEETITLDTAAAINEYFTRTESTQGTNTSLTNALKKYYYTLSGSKMSEKEENGNMTLESAAGARVSVGRGIDLTTGTLTDVIAENITIPAGQTSATTLFAGFASANATETFYIVETTPAEDNLIAPGYWTVTMTGVQGTGDASASQITDAKYYPERTAGVTPVAVGTTVSVEAAETARAAYSENTISYLFTIINEHYRPLYGAFALVKTDDLGAVYSGDVTFSVYGKNAFADGQLTGDEIAEITTDNGSVSLDVSTMTDGVVPAGRWEAEKSTNTKTFYLKETSAPGELIKSDAIIRVIVTGANNPANATAAYAVYDNGSWTALPVSATKTVSGLAAAVLVPNTAVTVSDAYVGYKTAPLNYAVIPNTRMKAAEVTKTWSENPYADELVSSIEITLYDQDGNKVTTDALGNAITNPITVTSGNESYQWKNLKYSDGTKELIYTAKETAINLTNGTKVTGSDIARYMTVNESEEEETKDVTDMGNVHVSVNSIVNTPDTWNNFFGVYKTDGTGNSVEATFGVYTDAALENKIADLTTTATKQTDTYNPGTWWATEGPKTYYIRETANDGSHVLYPFTIKVTITGSTREYEVVTDGLTAEEIAQLCENAGVSSTSVTAEDPNAALVYILNAPIEVHISKLDISNDVEVTGATLTVYRAVEDENGTVTDTVTGKKYSKGEVYKNETWVSSNTEHVIHNIETGTYILSEVTAPTDHGFVTASDVVFTIDNGKLTHTVTMYDERTELHIAKRDFTDGSDVPGAVLELTDANDNVVLSWTTGDDDSIVIGADYAENGLKAKAAKDENEDWIIVINYIPVGDYTLTETTAPNGYLRAESIPVTVTDSAIVSNVEMKDKRKVIVSKIDKHTDEAIPDVTMTIYKYDENAEEHKGDIAYQWVTTPNRNTAIPGMEPGKYVLEETVTGKGFNTADDIEFEVDADQDTEVHITMYDKPIIVKISKTDITTGEKVIGAHLSVITNQDINYNDTDYTAGDVILEWITTDQDMSIEYIPVGSYTLKETLPPDEYGYVTAHDVDFEVVTDKNANNGEGTTIEVKVEMKDDYTKTKLSKVNEYGELIAGAKLEIRKATENGYEDEAFKYNLPDGTEVVCAYTSTTTAIDVLYLPFGDYYLVEVESPDGYFTAEPKKFTVGDSAEVVSVTITNSRLSALPSTGSMSDFMTKVSGLFLILIGSLAIMIGQQKKKKIKA